MRNRDYKELDIEGWKTKCNEIAERIRTGKISALEVEVRLRFDPAEDTMLTKLVRIFPRIRGNPERFLTIAQCYDKEAASVAMSILTSK